MKSLKTRKKDKIVLDVDNSVNYKFDFDFENLAKKLILETYDYLKISIPTSVELLFVSKSDIKKLNNNERKINKITDVLSFPNISFKKPADFKNISNNDLSDSLYFDPYTKTISLGSIVICTDRMAEQAKKYGHSIKREYSFLFVHSLLHLLGYDHKASSTNCKMFDIQELILDNLNIIK